MEEIDRTRVFGERPEAVERIAPGYCRDSLTTEHVARYRWAARWVDGATVLDVACGTGYGAPILKGGGARRTVSVDVSLDALQFGSPRYHLSAVQADAHTLPFQPETFDVTVSLETIEHLSDPAGFLREVYRVLRDGGLLLASTPNEHLSDGSNPFHLHEFDLGALGDLLNQTGFEVLSTWGQHWRIGREILWKVWGMRGSVWRLQRSSRVTRLRPPWSDPGVWCLTAVKSS